jgi:hypothetical protein
MSYLASLPLHRKMIFQSLVITELENSYIEGYI